MDVSLGRNRVAKSEANSYSLMHIKLCGPSESVVGLG